MSFVSSTSYDELWSLLSSITEPTCLATVFSWKFGMLALSSIKCAVARIITRRREIVAMYDKAFENNSKLQIIKAPYADECSFHIYELCVPNREGLLGALAEHDIYGGVHYRDNTEYSMYTYAKSTCPKAHEMSEHLITLPLHMWLTDEEVQEIIKVVNDFVN